MITDKLNKITLNILHPVYFSTLRNTFISAVNWTMVMFVKSAANHSFHRELLRQTWGSYSYIDGFKLSTIFVTGKAEGNYQSLIDEEHERYGDILQLNISDAYLWVIIELIPEVRTVYIRVCLTNTGNFIFIYTKQRSVANCYFQHHYYIT